MVWSMCTMPLLVLDLDVLLLSDVSVSHLSVADVVLVVEEIDIVNDDDAADVVVVVVVV